MSYDLRNTSIGAYADIGSSSPQGSYLHRINDTGVGGAYDRKNSTSSGISYEVPFSKRHTIEAKVEGATH